MSSAPLQLSSYWRCDAEETDLRVDYQYNPSCMSTNVSLNNVSFIVPIDGGVTIMQSKPTAIWYVVYFFIYLLLLFIGGKFLKQLPTPATAIE